LADDNKITKVYFTDGRVISIPNEIDTYSINENILVISFKRGYRKNARYFFPIDNIRCIAYDNEEILSCINFTEDDDIREVVDRITEPDV